MFLLRPPNCDPFFIPRIPRKRANPSTTRHSVSAISIFVEQMTSGRGARSNGQEGYAPIGQFPRFETGNGTGTPKRLVRTTDDFPLVSRPPSSGHHHAAASDSDSAPTRNRARNAQTPNRLLAHAMDASTAWRTRITWRGAFRQAPRCCISCRSTRKPGGSASTSLGGVPGPFPAISHANWCVSRYRG